MVFFVLGVLAHPDIVRLVLAAGADPVVADAHGLAIGLLAVDPVLAESRRGPVFVEDNGRETTIGRR